MMETLRELIAQHASALGRNYDAIAALLNAPQIVDNPDAGKVTTVTTTTTTPITLKDVLAIVSPAERLAIRKQLPGFVDDVRRAIDTADADYMGVLITDAATDGAISVDTTAALTALLQEERTVTTTTEHTAPATISAPSLASAAGLGTVTAAAVQAALNA